MKELVPVLACTNADEYYLYGAVTRELATSAWSEPDQHEDMPPM